MPLERAGVVNGMQMSLYQRVFSLVRMDIEGWDLLKIILEGFRGAII